MSRQKRVESIFLYGVFFVYILLLLKMLFFSRIALSELFSGERTPVRSINLVPFATIGEYMAGETEDIRRFALSNVVGNMILFLPLGMFLSLFKGGKRAWGTLLTIFLISFFSEVLQWLFGIGASDMDDILLNCLGGLLGILVYRLFLLICRNEGRTRTVLTILSSLIGYPAMFYLLFMIQLRL